jgi:predicted membrane protein
MDYDHYCPWVNNAIGLLNIRYFVQFLFWASITSMYTFGYIFKHNLNCFLGEKTSCGWLYFNRSAITPQLLFSTLFGAFTITMFLEQMRNFKKGQTTIDLLKEKTHRSDMVHRYFGGYTIIGRVLPTSNIQALRERGKKTVTACVDNLTDNGFTISTEES